MERSVEQRQQDAKDRRRLVANGVNVATRGNYIFTASMCKKCQKLLRWDVGWIHYETGVIECG